MGRLAIGTAEDISARRGLLEGSQDLVYEGKCSYTCWGEQSPSNSLGKWNASDRTEAYVTVSPLTKWPQTALF